MFRSVLASRASEGQQGGSAQGLNWMVSGIGGASGQLESIEGRRPCSGRCPGGPAQMGEDLGDHGGCSMAGMIFKVPPHWEQCSISISNTRLSSRAQLMGAGGPGGGTSAWSAEGVLTLTGTFGMMSGRSLALRPRRAKQAPPWAWLRVRARHGSEPRCNRGRATSAASRCMNSSGDITDMGRAIPIGCFQCEHHLPGPVECKPFIGDGGAGDVAAEVLRPRRAKQATSLCLASEFLALMGSAAHLGMEACRRDPAAGGATQALHAPLRPEHRHRAGAGEHVPLGASGRRDDAGA